MQGLVSNAVRLGYLGIGLALAGPALIALPACGDDDEGASAADAATAGSGGGGGFTRPRPDAQVGTDPVPECDRADPLACGAGERCQVVIRRPAGEAQFLIYAGCIEDTDARGLGDPCEQWGGAALPYQAEGLDDELYFDPCAEGLFCAPDPVVRGSFSCQVACQSGLFDGFPQVPCNAAGEYCTAPSTATPYEEVCQPADDCDPTTAQGCGPDQGCFLWLDDTATGVLTLCLPLVDEPLADGLPCRAANECRPGSSCWGPTGLLPSRWESLACRRSCIAGQDVSADAGSDDDAGVSGGGACSAAAECVAFEGSGLDLSAVDPALGQCD